jgi:hypothetical protein
MLPEDTSAEEIEAYVSVLLCGNSSFVNTRLLFLQQQKLYMQHCKTFYDPTKIEQYIHFNQPVRGMNCLRQEQL